MFDIMSVAENIKEYRNKRGLNQYEFAEKLGISPQAVSKWECGQSCPSIENLCMISEILDVSIDELVGGRKDYEQTMIGIDGGGTKTEFSSVYGERKNYKPDYFRRLQSEYRGATEFT